MDWNHLIRSIKNYDTAQIFIEEEFLIEIAPRLAKNEGGRGFLLLTHHDIWPIGKLAKGDDFFKYGKDFPLDMYFRELRIVSMNV